ncbi:MAG TPA: rod-binding protein [Candidatus Limnocylindria bacterium]|jgi:Rod binding domain-containing protein|nr:rod-binding protein [Candidatus Limnocylindria bacterium]
MDPLSPTPTPASATPLTATQKQALGKLHDAAVQMESLFVDMMFKEMRKATPQVSLTGQPSQAEQMFGEMLDEKRSEQLAQSGSLGIAKVIEQQLRSAVLGSTPAVQAAPAPAPASKADEP